LQEIGKTKSKVRVERGEICNIKAKRRENFEEGE
jgi:hypothetical protein